MATIPFQHAALFKQGNVTDNGGRQHAAEPNRDTALMRATILASHWFRAAFFGAIIGVGALIMLLTGHAGAVLALPIAGVGAALALVAFRLARVACDRVDEAIESAPAKRNDTHWAS